VFVYFVLTMADDAKWNTMKNEMKMEVKEMLDEFARTVMRQMGPTGGQSGPTGGQSGHLAGQARREARDVDPRDETIAGLQALVKELQETVAVLKRQVSGGRGTEYLPAQEYGRQQQQRQQQTMERQRQQQQQRQPQQPAGAVPWATVVRGKGKKHSPSAVNAYGPRTCGMRSYGSGLDQFTIWECAQLPHPCTCGERARKAEADMRARKVPQGQRTVLQTLVKGPPKGKTTVVAKLVPEKKWTLRQPMAKDVGRLVNDLKVTIVQAARAYTEKEQKVDMGLKEGARLWQVTPGKPPGSWGVAAHPERYRSVLLVGQTLREAAGTAVALLTAWDAVERVSVVVCAERAGPSTRTGDQFLRALGATREEMAIDGADLVVHLSSNRTAWEAEEEGVQPQLHPGVQAMLIWTRTGEHEQLAVCDVDLPAMPASETWKVACQLDLHKLMAPDVQGKMKTEAWAKKEAWKRCGQQVASCAARSPPPMAVAIKGAMIEVEVPIRVEEAVELMKVTGSTAGVAFRPWINDDLPEALQATVHWLKEGQPVTGLALQARYAKLKHLPWFRGLVAGDSPTRYGVRAEGRVQDWQHRIEMCQALGLEPQHMRVRVQIRGHDHQFNIDAAQREAWQIFGVDGRIKVVDLRHRSGTGVDRPVYDAQVEGIPPGWDADRVLSGDPRCPTVTWRRTVIRKAPTPKITLNSKHQLDLTKLRAENEKERIRKEEAKTREGQAGDREATGQTEDMAEDGHMQDGPVGAPMEGDYELQ
jgi:hypothetical protein